MNSPDLQAVFGQHRYAVRFDWGPVGAQAAEADFAVVVDVLSFSTSVCVAVERGMSVFPYRWKGSGAEAFARDRDAVLAVGRLESTDCRTRRLPSPNGSTIATILDGAGAQVVTACLRNSAAVADVAAARLENGDSVAVIAAVPELGRVSASNSSRAPRFAPDMICA